MGVVSSIWLCHSHGTHFAFGFRSDVCSLLFPAYVQWRGLMAPAAVRKRAPPPAAPKPSAGRGAVVKRSVTVIEQVMSLGHVCVCRRMKKIPIHKKGVQHTEKKRCTIIVFRAFSRETIPFSNHGNSKTEFPWCADFLSTACSAAPTFADGIVEPKDRFPQRQLDG